MEWTLDLASGDWVWSLLLTFQICDHRSDSPEPWRPHKQVEIKKSISQDCLWPWTDVSSGPGTEGSVKCRLRLKVISRPRCDPEDRIVSHPPDSSSLNLRSHLTIAPYTERGAALPAHPVHCKGLERGLILPASPIPWMQRSPIGFWLPAVLGDTALLLGTLGRETRVLTLEVGRSTLPWGNESQLPGKGAAEAWEGHCLHPLPSLSGTQRPALRK